jgi:DNA mismatch repair protein MutL
MAAMIPGSAAAAATTSGGVDRLRAAATRVLEQGLSGSRARGTFWDELYKPQADDALADGAQSVAKVEVGRDGQAAGGTRRTFIQFDRTYIIAHADDALLILDQHTAHERVLFEAVLRGLHADLTTTQSLLFAQSLELDAELFAIFEAQSDLFLRAGFQARVFGTRTVLLEGAPAVLGGKSPERCFREVLDSLASELRSGRDRLSAMAASFACRAAVRSGDLLSETEMAALFEKLFQSQEPLTCPHGRPTAVRIARSELDRKFGRA